jgi:radical SAM protein with 4Fe4S-binding SPASM domain
LKRIKSKETDLDLSVYPNLTDDEIVKYYTTFDFLPDSYRRRCLSPWMVAYVFPDGSVRPCQSLNFIIGNIKEAGFKEIWNGKEALKFRNVLKKEGYFPVCPRCTEFYRF